MVIIAILLLAGYGQALTIGGLALDESLSSESKGLNISTVGVGNYSDNITKATAVNNTTIIITYPKYNITRDNNGFDSIEMEGSSQLFISGNPMLPYKMFNVLLPPNVNDSSINFEMTSAEIRILPGEYEIKPCPPENGSQDILSDNRNNSIYESDIDYPKQFVILKPLSHLRKWKFIPIKFMPFQYNPVQKKLTLIESVTLKISYIQEKLPAASIQNLTLDTVMDDIAPNIFYNYNETRGFYPESANITNQTIGYAIITTKAIKAGSNKLNSFIAHKQSRGFNVIVVTEDDFGSLWGESPHKRAEQIREWLKLNYQSKRIKYALLIGNPTPSGPIGGGGDIPMKLCHPTGRCENPADWTPTDFYYADLQEDWDDNGDLIFAQFGIDNLILFPDVYVGRIPVYDTNYKPLDNILQKIINYENSHDVEWRNNALLAMGFWYENADASPLGEALKDYCLQPMGVAYWRMYLKGSAMPCQLDSKIYCEEELRGSIIPGNPSVYRGPTKMGDRWAANPYGIVCWCGHGTSGLAKVSECMKKITDATSIDCDDGYLFVDYECPRLNDNYPAFVFSCSCLNGQPEERGNLMYLLLENGAVSTVGSSRTTHFPYPFSKEKVPSLWGNYRMGYEYIKGLVVSGLPAGAALGSAYYSTDPSDGKQLKCILEFNLYGDPSLLLLIRGDKCEQIKKDIKSLEFDLHDCQERIKTASPPEKASLGAQIHEIIYEIKSKKTEFINSGCH